MVLNQTPWKHTIPHPQPLIYYFPYLNVHFDTYDVDIA